MRRELKVALVRPLMMLATVPALQAIAVFRTYLHGVVYLVFGTFTMVFQESYVMSLGTASLDYVSLCLGFTIRAQL